jgi:hypothetical protein
MLPNNFLPAGRAINYAMSLPLTTLAFCLFALSFLICAEIVIVWLYVISIYNFSRWGFKFHLSYTNRSHVCWKVIQIKILKYSQRWYYANKIIVRQQESHVKRQISWCWQAIKHFKSDSYLVSPQVDCRVQQNTLYSTWEVKLFLIMQSGGDVQPRGQTNVNLFQCSQRS